MKRVPGNPATFTVFDTFYCALGAAAAAVAVPKGYIQSRGDAVATKRFFGRLGCAAERSDVTTNRFLLHGVSVGEVKLIKPLLAAIQTFSNLQKKIEPLVTSTTPAGLGEAERLFSNCAREVYPIDFPTCPSRFLKNTRPDRIVLLEWEVWPLFLQKAALYKIPTAIVNARVSEKTVKRYQLLPEFAARRLGAISIFAAQNEVYAERLLKLGVPKDKIVITGNLKFDGLPDPALARDAGLAKILNLKDGEPLLVAGSTHEPEEEILARAVASLRAGGMHNLRFVIVPRHVERAPRILQKIEPILGPAVLRSSLTLQNPPANNKTTVVVDTVGELEKLYRFATVAFVGGSLQNDRGGQNMLEPAALGVPVIHGPSVPNFTEAAEILQKAGGSVIVANESELTEALAGLLRDPAAAAKQAGAAAAALEPHRGSARRTADALLERNFL